MEFSRRTTLISALALAAEPATSWADPGPRRLSNPQASNEARALYSSLWSLYGRKTLTGQQEGVGHATPLELDDIAKVTGRQPAILGLDYIDPRDNTAVNDRVTAWRGSGGIVTLC